MGLNKTRGDVCSLSESGKAVHVISIEKIMNYDQK
jgi:hypothetical protein